MEQINDQNEGNPPEEEEDLHDNEECGTIVEEEEVTSHNDDVDVTSQSMEKIEDVVEGVQKKDDVIKSWLQSSAEN